MDPAPFDQVANLRSRSPVEAGPELAIDDLARLFGIADMVDAHVAPFPEQVRGLEQGRRALDFAQVTHHHRPQSG